MPLRFPQGTGFALSHKGAHSLAFCLPARPVWVSRLIAVQPQPLHANVDGPHAPLQFTGHLLDRAPQAVQLSQLFLVLLRPHRAGAFGSLPRRGRGSPMSRSCLCTPRRRRCSFSHIISMDAPDRLRTASASRSISVHARPALRRPFRLTGALTGWEMSVSASTAVCSARMTVASLSRWSGGRTSPVVGSRPSSV